MKSSFAVFHALEVLGEVAHKLSKEFEQSHPDFPVRETIEMRNILIHGYDIVRLDVVWNTITDNLPSLKKQLQDLL